MESPEWNNGLFTYSFIKSLSDPIADADKNGNITFSEVAENIKNKVTMLSAGKQRPITRGINREIDQIISNITNSTNKYIESGDYNAASINQYEQDGNFLNTVDSMNDFEKTIDNLLLKNNRKRSQRILSFEAALAKANAGDAYAQAIVSIYYGLGFECKQDAAKSKEYVMLSAKQQNPLGIYRLAEMREAGQGMDQNSAQAAQLMQKAKSGLQKLYDDPYAMTALATIYERENPSSPKVRELLTKASAMGYDPAQKKLAQIQSNN
jgi:TPR repeat protein